MYACYLIRLELICLKHGGNLFLHSCTDKGVDGYTGLFGEIGHAGMYVGGEPHVKRARIVFMRFDIFFFAESEIIVDSLVEGLGEFGHTLTLEVHKSVYAFDLSKEYSAGLAESHRPDKILIFHRIHISPSFFRYS